MSDYVGDRAHSRIHAFVICWPGVEENARHIARSIVNAVDRLTVIYSTKDDTTESGEGEWIQVSDAWYYGKKFQECLKRHSGAIMLQIHADATSGDWPTVIDRCKKAHENYDNLGVWAPDVEFTTWDTPSVKICDFVNDELVVVAQTDCIVWSLSSAVAERLKAFDYDCNNLGWGIDWAGIAFASNNDLLVLRDSFIRLHHPRTQRYSGDDAALQMEVFLDQMTLHEKKQYILLNAYIEKKKHDQNREGKTDYFKFAKRLLRSIGR